MKQKPCCNCPIKGEHYYNCRISVFDRLLDEPSLMDIWEFKIIQWLQRWGIL